MKIFDRNKSGERAGKNDELTRLAAVYDWLKHKQFNYFTTVPDTVCIEQTASQSDHLDCQPSEQQQAPE